VLPSGFADPNHERDHLVSNGINAAGGRVDRTDPVSKKLLAQQVVNSQLSSEVGKQVIMIEVLPVRSGTRLNVTFSSQSGTWREGLWLAIDGALEIAGTQADQFELWTDTAPRSFDVDVVESRDGLLRLFNIWDSGRGKKHESQSFTFGMLKEERPDGTLVYRCNDIGRSPQFDKLIFELRFIPD
jgi:hypothetical protein